uniref:Uncharacterized protein n=1 Tax=Rhizophora mucronata TaxID=61149 RepID=A0A2P2QLD8_RHIMU
MRRQKTIRYNCKSLKRDDEEEDDEDDKEELLEEEGGKGWYGLAM